MIAKAGSLSKSTKVNCETSSSQSSNMVLPAQVPCFEKTHEATSEAMEDEITSPTDQKKHLPHDVAPSPDCGKDSCASSGDLKDDAPLVTPRTHPPNKEDIFFHNNE